MNDLLNADEREALEEARMYRYENPIIGNLVAIIDNLTRLNQPNSANLCVDILDEHRGENTPYMNSL